MGNLVQREALPRITDAASYHVTGPQVRDLHLMAGIKASTVFDGVYKHLAKRRGNCTSLWIGKFGNLIQKLEYSIGRVEVAASVDPNPFRSCGNYIDAVIPAGFFNCAPDHDGQRPRREWFGEIAE